MNILVLGGTGFIGPHVIRRLVAEHHDVTVFHRGKTITALPPSVGYIFGNYKNIPDSREDFRRLAPEVVLDMIPITEQDARNVMSAFRGIARRVVAASSQDVYLAWGVVSGTDAGPVDRRLTEDSPVRESRYPYRDRKMPAYIEWDFENYDKILVVTLQIKWRKTLHAIWRILRVWTNWRGSREMLESAPLIDSTCSNLTWKMTVR